MRSGDKHWDVKMAEYDRPDSAMREWLVIEDSRKNGVFAPEEAKTPNGYIPRDVAEKLLGRSMEGTQWFTREESELMRAHPEWRAVV